MQDIISILNQGWIGVVIGVLSLILYWRSRLSGILAVKSREVSMIGGEDSIFPREVEVRYRGNPVSRLTSSTVWIWNAGKKTLREEDLTARDPLRLHFSGSILNVKIRRTSRPVAQMSAARSENDSQTVLLGFEFLDPSDGLVVQVLHSGSDEHPECLGTIIGPPKAPRYWGHAWGGYTDSIRKFRIAKAILWACLAIGLWFGILGVLGNRIVEIIPIHDVEDAMPRWSYLTLGFLYTILPSFFLWTRRRRFPSTLIIDKGVEE